MRTASDVLVTVELFLNARYGYDTRCEVVMESGTSALTLPTHIVTDAERRRAVAYPADWIPRYSDAYRIELQEWIDSITQGQAVDVGRRGRWPTRFSGRRCARRVDANQRRLGQGA